MRKIFTINKPVAMTRKSPNKRFDSSSTMDVSRCITNLLTLLGHPLQLGDREPK